MVTKRPKIVIIGAGMAGLTAANKLITTPGAKDMFDLCIVEGGQRIGGRINTTEFGGDRVEMGATWIHGITGSPIYNLAKDIHALQSHIPWECMDALIETKVALAQTHAEGGFKLDSNLVERVSLLFEQLMSEARGGVNLIYSCSDFAGAKTTSIGSFLKLGLDKYWDFEEEDGGDEVFPNWTRKMLLDAVFGVFENVQRTYTGAGDLFNLDYAAEREYEMFPGDEITIPKGYVSVIEALASVLPPGLIQLGKKVVKIEWESETDCTSWKPVTLNFSDGSVIQADHVIVTVSLGVLKAGVKDDAPGLFTPSLPSSKVSAITRLGYGVVNKLFLQLNNSIENDEGDGDLVKFPFMQMAFHRSDSEFRDCKVPWWMRRTASLYPIYETSKVVLSWFAGKEALELETLDDEAIIEGVSTTVSSFISSSDHPHETCNGGGVESKDRIKKPSFESSKVLKSKWGSDPLFLGSYSYVAVGSSGDDIDTLAKPLPGYDGEGENGSSVSFPLQILFAGEATHRTHYSTTHGAYFSGLREANRLLEYYNLSLGDGDGDTQDISYNVFSTLSS